ncbi:MAG: ABC-F family ATP-binding cassette domain-containing protein [Bacillota bacterium]
MSILDIKNLTHKFDSKPLFADASLSINNGEHAGIVGSNGSGKSTFLNIIIGSIPQDEGEVKWRGNVRRGYLDQHANIDRTKSVMEYLRQSFDHLYAENDRMEKLYEDMATITDMDEIDKMMNRAGNILDMLTMNGFFDIDARIKKVATGLGVHNFGYDTLVATLSGGQRAKLLLCKLLLEQPDVMMLDEPTNFLDIEHIEWLVEFLNSFEGTYLIVSHDTDFLDRVCRQIISMESFTIKKYSGNYTSYRAQSDQNAKQYEEAYIRQQREISKKEEFIARNKARAATAGMARSRQKQLDKMEVVKKPSVVYDAEFSFPYSELNSKNLIVVNDLEIGYTFRLLPPINMHLNSHSKIWIRGTNGIGKSTFLKTILSQLNALGGEFKWDLSAKVATLNQDLDFDNQAENAVTYFNNRFPKFNAKAVRSALAGVGIKNELATKPIVDLSGGEQVRIVLATLMQKVSNVLVLDEPTNHLDVKAKNALQKALIAYPGAVILVSHEKEFAETICTEISDVKY